MKAGADSPPHTYVFAGKVGARYAVDVLDYACIVM